MHRRPASPRDVPFAVAVWNRRQRKQHQYTPSIPIEYRWVAGDEDAAPNADTRNVSHRDLRWKVAHHQAHAGCGSADKVTAIPGPDARGWLAQGGGRVPTGTVTGDGRESMQTRLVSHRQLMREKMAHKGTLYNPTYNL